jgi:hypothetical protein
LRRSKIENFDIGSAWSNRVFNESQGRYKLLVKNSKTRKTSFDWIERYRCLAVGFRQRPYFVEYTRSHPNSEVKRRKARSVLGWGTAREALRVLLAFCFLFISKSIEPSRDDFLTLGATCQCILKAFKKPLKKQWFFEGF